MSAVAGVGVGQPSERDRLVAAFVLLSGTRGYRELDTAEVARQAGLEPGAFERHFADPLQCFAAAYDELEEIYLRQIAGSHRELPGWLEQLRAAIAETLSLAEAHPASARFMTTEALAAGEPGRRRQRALDAKLEAMLDRGLAEAGAEVPENASGWILATVFDRLYRHLISGTENRLTAELPELMFLALSPLLGPDIALAEYERAMP